MRGHTRTTDERGEAGSEAVEATLHALADFGQDMAKHDTGRSRIDSLKFIGVWLALTAVVVIVPAAFLSSLTGLFGLSEPQMDRVLYIAMGVLALPAIYALWFVAPRAFRAAALPGGAAPP